MCLFLVPGLPREINCLDLHTFYIMRGEFDCLLQMGRTKRTRTIQGACSVRFAYLTNTNRDEQALRCSVRFGSVRRAHSGCRFTLENDASHLHYDERQS